MPQLRTRPRLRRGGLLREVISTAVFLVAVFTLLQMAIPRSEVLSISMQPNLIESQRLVISRINYLFGNPQRGDIVVFDPPGSAPNDPPLIKRLIGLPNETIEFRDALVYINGVKLDEPYIKEPCQPYSCPNQKWTLGQNEYFFMGDNRNHSRDSRSFGPITHDRIFGRAIFRWWPLDKIGPLTFTYPTEIP
jgi:signal peptidase I